MLKEWLDEYNQEEETEGFQEKKKKIRDDLD